MESSSSASVVRFRWPDPDLSGDGEAAARSQALPGVDALTAGGADVRLSAVDAARLMRTVSTAKMLYFLMKQIECLQYSN